MNDRAGGFVIYPDGKTMWYGTGDDSTIPDDVDLDRFLIGRVKLVGKRSWRRLGRKTWRMKEER